MVYVDMGMRRHKVAVAQSVAQKCYALVVSLLRLRLGDMKTWRGSCFDVHSCINRKSCPAKNDLGGGGSYGSLGSQSVGTSCSTYRVHGYSKLFLLRLT